MTRIYHSPYPPLNVPTNKSVSQFLLECNPDDVEPSKTIVEDFDSHSTALTYGGLRRDASLYAYALKHWFGLRAGDTVCIVAKNSVNWVLLAHAVMWAGGCFSAVNPAATSFELEHYFTIAEPSIIAVDSGQLPTVEKALSRLGTRSRPQVILIDDGSDAVNNAPAPLFPRDFHKEDSPTLQAYDLSDQDNRNIPVAMCFSSGTSGKPKGVLISHYNLIAYAMTLRSTTPSTTNMYTKEVFFPSFAHIYGIVTGLLMPAFAGNHLVAMRTFDFLPYLQKAAEIRATLLRLVPATAIRLIKDPEVKKLDLSSVQFVYCAGASLETAVAQAMQKMLNGTSILNGYGMSEGTISMLKEGPSERKAGSVGKPAAGVSIRVVDDNMNDVPEGVDGECLWKGPTLFMGYKSNDAETRNSFHDGWLCTGDVVRVDQDGYFYITGRKKELIKFKGNQVPPAEIEAVLLSHPLVLDAGVCGVYDQQYECEVPVGYVSLDPSIQVENQTKALEEIKAFVHERVARYKQLRGGLFVLSEMPKNANGKLMRRELPAKKEEIRQSKL